MVLDIFLVCSCKVTNPLWFLQRIHTFNSFGNLLRMVHQKLSVIHPLEHLNMHVRAYGEQIISLRFGYERLLCAVPEMYVGT